MKIHKQKQKQLIQFLSRQTNQKWREADSRALSDKFMNDQKRKSTNKSNRSKRFSTAPDIENFQMDYRLKTFYKPNNQYKFTGKCYRKFFAKSNKTKINQTLSSLQTQKLNKQLSNPQTQEISLQYLKKQQNSDHLQTQTIAASEFRQVPKNQSLTIDSQIHLNNKNQIIQSKNFSEVINGKSGRKKQTKFKFNNPTPVRQEQFFIKTMKNFVTKQRERFKHASKSLPKMKGELQATSFSDKQKNNLINFQQFLTQQKEKFKRVMECQLIRVGQSKLLSQLRFQDKGKVYLKGLHNENLRRSKKAKSQSKQIKIKQLLNKSKNNYYSKPSIFLEHIATRKDPKKKNNKSRYENKYNEND